MNYDLMGALKQVQYDLADVLRNLRYLNGKEDFELEELILTIASVKDRINSLVDRREIKK